MAEGKGPLISWFYVDAKENLINIITEDRAVVKIICHPDHKWMFVRKEPWRSAFPPSYEKMSIMRPMSSADFFALIEKEFNTLEEKTGGHQDSALVANAHILWQHIRAHVPLGRFKASQSRPTSSASSPLALPECAISSGEYCRIDVPNPRRISVNASNDPPQRLWTRFMVFFSKCLPRSQNCCIFFFSVAAMFCALYFLGLKS
jgi:hypothetical protein